MDARTLTGPFVSACCDTEGGEPGYSGRGRTFSRFTQVTQAHETVYNVRPLPDITQLHERLVLALRHRSWESFSALIHPEVEFRSVVEPSRTYAGRHGARAWWDEMSELLVFQPTFGDIVPLSERVVFIAGRIQASMSTGIRDTPACWVLVAKDHLLWRWRPVQSESEAFDYAEELGALIR